MSIETFKTNTKRKKNEKWNRLFKNCETITKSITYIISEGEGREKRTGKIFKVIMAEDFPKFITDTKPQNQETSSRINARKSKPKCIIFKIQETKYKGKVLEEGGEKLQLIYRGKKIFITLDFSSQTVQGRR